ncbi:MAG TPA: bifunctional YncE family protein/alkaline phosphatase family protein [Bryobacteraceae bacterium]|nr:bifunctional YncE family protein/alkaline phosphatase family protein [Bryobacteraceae bacterium]
MAAQKRDHEQIRTNTVGILAIVFSLATAVAVFAAGLPPAGIRPPSSDGKAAILPGGRVAAPLGKQIPTGAEPIGLAISPSGKYVLTVNAGPKAGSLTVLEKAGKWVAQQIRIPAEVSGGVAFSGEHAAWVAEGDSGRIELIDLAMGGRRREIDLNQGGLENSFAGALAFDGRRELLYVADRANRRVAVVDARTRRAAASLAVMEPPRALALSPDGRTLYIAAGSVGFADVSDGAHPKLAGAVPTSGKPVAVLATADRVYAASADDDSITAINAASRRVEWRVPIRIPGMETLRGVEPSSLAWDETSGWLLVAESGINAVGVIDARAGKFLGHLPAGWRPTQVLIRGGSAFVANGRGLQAGPPSYKEGSISVYVLPAASELAADTEYVMRANGFVPAAEARPFPPAGIRLVVLIVKGTRSFDEVLGDLTQAANGAVMAAPALAHLGSRGYADGERKRLSLQGVNVTPNQNAIARQFSFSDNFYADGEDEAETYRRLEDGPLWESLSRNGISFRKFTADRNALISDTERARKFIETMESDFGKTGAEPPRFVYLELPNDSIARPLPERGYLYPESAASDNDYAVGLVLAFLAKTPWWKEMAVFVTGAASSGFDHIDAHRTVLECAGPWAKPNFVSHTNTSFPGLLKTILEILRVPEMDLAEAAAADLNDCFRSRPDSRGYNALPEDERIYAAPRP